jgi:hypothetical protein
MLAAAWNRTAWTDEEPAACPVEQVAGAPEVMWQSDLIAELEGETSRFEKALTPLGRVEQLWREGWDVEFLFGPAAVAQLKDKYPYYPLTGTGVGLAFDRAEHFVAVRRVDPAGPCAGRVRQGDLVIAVGPPEAAEEPLPEAGAGAGAWEEVWGERQLDGLLRGAPSSRVALLLLPRERAPDAHRNRARPADCYALAAARMPYEPRMQAEAEWLATRREDIM